MRYSGLRGHNRQTSSLHERSDLVMIFSTQNLAICQGTLPSLAWIFPLKRWGGTPPVITKASLIPNSNTPNPKQYPLHDVKTSQMKVCRRITNWQMKTCLTYWLKTVINFYVSNHEKWNLIWSQRNRIVLLIRAWIRLCWIKGNNNMHSRCLQVPSLEHLQCSATFWHLSRNHSGAP